MKESVSYTSDYSNQKEGSHNQYGQLFWTVRGMAEPGKLFTVIPVKPGLSLSFMGNAIHDYPHIKYEVKNSPVDFSFCLSGTCV